MMVVEPLGIYVNNLRNWMASHSIPHPAGLPESEIAERPAILLCPEAMSDLALKFQPACQSLQNRFDSAQDAFDFILCSVLSHEFGHHFFPTQKSGGGIYLNEALANLFAYYGLKEGIPSGNPASLVDRLVYKTWMFQPDCYSAYRSLNAILEVDPHTRFAVGMCFTSGIWQWASLKGKPFNGFYLDLGPSRKMGLCLDYRASQSLWYDEIGDIMGEHDQWLDRLFGEGLYFHCSCVRHCMTSGWVSPDLVADLYGLRHLNCWLDDARLFLEHFWRSRGYQPDVSWPYDCLDQKEISERQELSDSAAEALGRIGGSYQLTGLTKLSDTAAARLTQVIGSGLEITLPQELWESLSDEARQSLSQLGDRLSGCKRNSDGIWIRVPLKPVN